MNNKGSKSVVVLRKYGKRKRKRNVPVGVGDGKETKKRKLNDNDNDSLINERNRKKSSNVERNPKTVVVDSGAAVDMHEDMKTSFERTWPNHKIKGNGDYKVLAFDATKRNKQNFFFLELEPKEAETKDTSLNGERNIIRVYSKEQFRDLVEPECRDVNSKILNKNGLPRGGAFDIISKKKDRDGIPCITKFLKNQNNNNNIGILEYFELFFGRLDAEKSKLRKTFGDDLIDHIVEDTKCYLYFRKKNPKAYEANQGICDSEYYEKRGKSRISPIYANYHEEEYEEEESIIEGVLPEKKKKELEKIRKKFDKIEKDKIIASGILNQNYMKILINEENITIDRTSVQQFLLCCVLMGLQLGHKDTKTMLGAKHPKPFEVVNELMSTNMFNTISKYFHMNYSDVEELFNIYSPQLYEPGVLISIDESIVAFKGACKSKISIREKPRSIGIKIQNMSDSNGYCLGMFFCEKVDKTEKKSNNKQKSKVATEYVKKFMFQNPSIKSLRNLKFKKWVKTRERFLLGDGYYSFEEVAQLFCSGPYNVPKRIRYIGTLEQGRKDSREISRFVNYKINETKQELIKKNEIGKKKKKDTGITYSVDYADSVNSPIGVTGFVDRKRTVHFLSTDVLKEINESINQSNAKRNQNIIFIIFLCRIKIFE